MEENQFSYQYIIVEFAFDKDKNYYFPYISFVLDSENVMVTEGKDHDQDVDKLIGRVAEFLFANFKGIMEHSAIHLGDDKFKEINLKDYVKEDMLIALGEDFETEFNLYEYVKNNNLILVAESENIH